MSKALCNQHCTVNIVKIALCYEHHGIRILLLGQCCLQCAIATWLNSGEFTLFQRKLQYVAKYASFVLFFGTKYSSVLLFTLFTSLEIVTHHKNHDIIYFYFWSDGQQKGPLQRTIEFFGQTNNIKVHFKEQQKLRQLQVFQGPYHIYQVFQGHINQKQDLQVGIALVLTQITSEINSQLCQQVMNGNGSSSKHDNVQEILQWFEKNFNDMSPIQSHRLN